jgi:hypothetical protein
MYSKLFPPTLHKTEGIQLPMNYNTVYTKSDIRANIMECRLPSTLLRSVGVRQCGSFIKGIVARDGYLLRVLKFKSVRFVRLWFS